MEGHSDIPNNCADGCLVPFGGASLLVACITVAYFVKPWGVISFLLCIPYFFFWRRRIEAQRVAQREEWVRAHQVEGNLANRFQQVPPLSAAAVVTGPATSAQNPNFPTAVVVDDTSSSNGWETSQRQALDKASRN